MYVSGSRKVHFRIIIRKYQNFCTVVHQAKTQNYLFVAAQELKKIVVHIIISVYEIMSVNRDHNKIQRRKKKTKKNSYCKRRFYLDYLLLYVHLYRGGEEKILGFLSHQNIFLFYQVKNSALSSLALLFLFFLNSLSPVNNLPFFTGSDLKINFLPFCRKAIA